MFSESIAPGARREDPPASLLYRPASFFERLPLAELFPGTRPLEVELGSGDGSFLVAYAGQHPDRDFLGVERLLGRIRKIDRKGRRAGLRNLRLLRIEAAYFMEYLLPDRCVTALHVYFPDPWPKRRHWPNRLIGERFPGLARRVLQPGGRVFLRTDNEAYFEQMQRVLSGDPAFSPTEPPPDLASLVTDFERNFHAQGTPTLQTAFQLMAFG
jgi:tRNA (guanine-N7-)-methyltransferase